jgi:Family of unknown function (DUF5681)
MSNRKPSRKEYAIGYGKPPVHTRFAKGQSGNPKGRPKNPSKNTSTSLTRSCSGHYGSEKAIQSSRCRHTGHC